MTAHPDNDRVAPATSASSNRTDRLLPALAIVWFAALLALIPGAATSSGVAIATSLIVMGITALLLLGGLAVENFRVRGVASSDPA